MLAREPEWQSLPANLHSRIRLLLERCLKKEPTNRYRDIGDARVDLQEVLADPSGVFAQPVATVKPKAKQRQILLWVSITVVLIIIAGVAVWLLKPSPTLELKRVMRSEYVLPEEQQFFRPTFDGRIQLAVSTDGSQFAYSTTKGIYIRSMNELEARPIRGTDEDAQALFFSPDGQWIGYFSASDHKLKRISVNGGAPTDLCDTFGVSSATWYEDNTIVYSDTYSGVFRITAKGGTPETLVKKPMVDGGQLLPDGKSVMFVDVGSQPYKTMVQSLETGAQKIVSIIVAG